MPHAAFVPQAALVPHAALVPQAAFVPQAALLPQIAVVPPASGTSTTGPHTVDANQARCGPPGLRQIWQQQSRAEQSVVDDLRRLGRAEHLIVVGQSGSDVHIARADREHVVVIGVGLAGGGIGGRAHHREALRSGLHEARLDAVRSKTRVLLKQQRDGARDHRRRHAGARSFGNTAVCPKRGRRCSLRPGQCSRDSRSPVSSLERAASRPDCREPQRRASRSCRYWWDRVSCSSRCGRRWCSWWLRSSWPQP